MAKIKSKKTTKNENKANKTILMLGAGPFQLSGIKKAKEMGLKVIAMDANTSAPGLKEADIGLAINFLDENKVIEAAKKYSADGIMTMCSEVGVMPAAKACEALGLPGIGLKSAEACTNKILMRKALRKKGVSVPNFYGTSVLKEAEDFAKETGFPLIIKPAVGSGSRGVRKLESMAELAEAFDNAKKISRDSRIIIEQFMEGIDTTVDCIIHKGKLEVLGIADKIKSPLPYRSDIMIYYPANFDAEIINEIIVAAKKTAEAVGLKEGPAHIEMLINNKSIRVVEIAARGGGFKTFDLIDQAVSGVDTVGESIKIALGMEVDVKPRLKRAALLYFFKENPGKLIKITGENEARKIKGVIELVITVKPGELVKEYTCGDDRIGYFVAVADTRTEIEKIQKEVESVLKFHIKKWRNE